MIAIRKIVAGLFATQQSVNGTSDLVSSARRQLSEGSLPAAAAYMRLAQIEADRAAATAKRVVELIESALSERP